MYCDGLHYVLLEHIILSEHIVLHEPEQKALCWQAIYNLRQTTTCHSMLAVWLISLLHAWSEFILVVPSYYLQVMLLYNHLVLAVKAAIASVQT